MSVQASLPALAGADGGGLFEEAMFFFLLGEAGELFAKCRIDYSINPIFMSHAHWLAKLTNLNKARNNAPHKPLLLLVFLELVEKGELAGGVLPLTPELAYRFDTFFEVARHRRAARPDVRLPFHHLSTQGFWSPRTATSELTGGLVSVFA